MLITRSIDEMRAARRAFGLSSVGLVPTMGYLHEGHLALVGRARSETDFSVASIYVNPRQFGPTEDLARYPRALERDLALLDAAGVDAVFVPADDVMYPAGFQTRVIVNEVTQPLEGARRPGHFEGVATVVAKLFNIVQPTHVYFGQKDAQQTVVIRQMIRDLNFNLEMVICPTVREPDGLAMSSRNKYLTHDQRAAAPVLYAALSAAAAAWNDGLRDSRVLREIMQTTLDAEPLARPDYVSVADPESLVEYTDAVPAGAGALLSLAVFLGATRLIDNILVTG